MKKQRVKIRGSFSIQPKVPEILVGTLYIKINGMDHFGLVWAEYSGPALKVVLFDQSGYLGLMNQN